MVPAKFGDLLEPFLARPGTKDRKRKNIKKLFQQKQNHLILQRKPCTCGLLRRKSKFPAFAFEPIFGSPCVYIGNNCVKYNFRRRKTKSIRKSLPVGKDLEDLHWDHHEELLLVVPVLEGL